MKKTLVVCAAMAICLKAGGDIAPASQDSSCGLYTYTYMPQSGVEDPCIDTGIHNGISGKTLLHKHIRFHVSLHFGGNGLTEASQKALETVKDQIKTHPGAYVALIGHTSGYADREHYVPMNGWSSFWQRFGGERTMTQEEVVDEVNGRIKNVYDLLTDGDGISASRIYTENRLARDPVATEATGEGRAMNERVDLFVLD